MSPPDTEQAQTTFTRDQLKAIVERIERLEEEKKTISDDIRDIFAEAKGNGFDTKALRAVIRLRKQDANERAEHEAILDTYLNALGMLASTPLGKSALDRAAKAGTTARMAQAATQAQKLADVGLISRESADSTTAAAAAVATMYGAPSADVMKAVKNPKVKAAFAKLGTPTELTDKEKAEGAAAFVGKDGTRMTIGPSRMRARDEGDGGQGAPPASETPPSTPPPAASAAGSCGGDGVAPTCLGRPLEAGPFAGEAPGPQVTIDPKTDMPTFVLRGHPDCPVGRGLH